MKTSRSVFRFKAGRVIEIAHDRKGFGYLIAAFHRPRKGKYFRLVTKVYQEPVAEDELDSLQQAPHTTVWLNSYRLLGRDGPAKFRLRERVVSFPLPNSRFWFGPEDGPITLTEEDGNYSYENVNVPLEQLELEMERRGYVEEVLWLPKSIVDFLFEGRPLRWSAHKKY